MSVIWWALGIVGAFILWLAAREFTQYLPRIGPWLFIRSVRGLPEPTQTQLREKWLAIAAEVPGDLTRVLWGLTCYFIGRQTGKNLGKPADPVTVRRLLHGIFFLVYLKTIARDFIRLRFASPKQLKLRWLLLRSFADRALDTLDGNNSG